MTPREPLSRDARRTKRRDAWRNGLDRLLRLGIYTGGIGVLVAATAIILYLTWVVLPLFASADLEAVETVPRITDGETLHLTMEQPGETLVRLTAAGRVIVLNSQDGSPLSRLQVPGIGPTSWRSFRSSAADPNTVVYGLASGRALVTRIDYATTYAPGTGDSERPQRRVQPRLAFPLGREPVTIAESGAPLIGVAVHVGDDRSGLLAVDEAHRLVFVAYRTVSGLFGGPPRSAVPTQRFTRSLTGAPQAVLLGPRLRYAYVVYPEGTVELYRIDATRGLVRADRARVLPAGVRVQAARFLAGGESLLIADDRGTIQQWFTAPAEGGEERLVEVRRFRLGEAPITALATEPWRKGFAAADAAGRVGLFHGTTHRSLAKKRVSETPLTTMILSARGDRLFAEGADGALRRVELDNPHPDVSWSVLWQPVWYEGYAEPEYRWQSSAATSDFEPKFSLVPLTFGTLKAALYALLIAVPLALLSAVFTAYFMAPRMRRVVKPTLELMGALPTVILGFVAGLWLAPVVEARLAGLLLAVAFVPLVVLVGAAGWGVLPASFRTRWAGWEPFLLIPLVIAAVAGALGLGEWLDAVAFGGELTGWLGTQWGIDYDERNALVIGLAMGLAVIPTIFSLAEDAVFNVPRHLTESSLALGATLWQTLTRVVLPTASPGIFSALMVGLARAVGETMIVLMATGNTPIMDANLFEGMRTLSATIAIEMPEAQVGSSHYRVLFLVALLLFVFTFAVNTGAELIRHRLRQRYRNL